MERGGYEHPYQPDPSLIQCLCRKCSRGGRCRTMQQLLKDVVTADQAAHDAVARACLTDEDRHWLKSVTQSEELPLID